MGHIKRLFFALVLSTLSACGSMPANFSSEAELKEGHGLLLVNLKSDWPAIKSPIQANLKVTYKGENDKNSFYRGLIFKEEEYLAFIQMKADKYRVRHLEFGDFFAPLSSSGFEIKENTITYIGDIYASMNGMRGTIYVLDEMDVTLKLLEEQYPGLQNRYPLEKKILKIISP